MDQIAHVPSNGYKMVSTFSGCGGSCLGFKMAGFDVLWANEFIPEAQETYRANHPATMLDTRDIRTVNAEDILSALSMKSGDLDVFEGSPPCSAFSTAGSRNKGWGKEKNYSDGAKQIVDDLFFEYARLLDGLQPKVFVAENVSGLVKGTAKGYFKEILRGLRQCGYQVEARLLDAQWLGVPQARQRLIFLGVRNDLNVGPSFPSPLPYRYSVNEALSMPHDFFTYDSRGAFGKHDLTGRPVNTITTNNHHWRVTEESRIVVRRGPKAERVVFLTKNPSPTVTAGGLSNVSHYQAAINQPGTHDPETGQELKVGPYVWNDDGNAYDPETGARIDIRETSLDSEWEREKASSGSAKFFQLRVAEGNKPLATVTASGGGRGTAGVTHMTPRKFTLGELRRLCGFPDDFVLTGSYAQRWERLGRSVPPVMMSHVAAHIRDEILPKCVD
jgi:DNA (cytosine-5)-methyltransferase 1